MIEEELGERKDSKGDANLCDGETLVSKEVCEENRSEQVGAKCVKEHHQQEAEEQTTDSINFHPPRRRHIHQSPLAKDTPLSAHKPKVTSPFLSLSLSVSLSLKQFLSLRLLVTRETGEKEEVFRRSCQNKNSEKIYSIKNSK
jgi:hypothetical protein